MKILVTGCLGFIGSTFCKKIYNDKDTIIGTNRISNTKNHRRLDDIMPNTCFNLVYKDLARDDVSDLFQDVDYVFHFSALTFVDRSIQNPQPFIESNVSGTFKMLEAARKCETLKRFFNISTDEVYGSILKGSYNETAPLNPTNPYSATKAAQDMLALAYYNTYGLPIIITRTENVYGPYQGTEKVIPTFVRKALTDEPLPVYGDGHHSRQWIHVEDKCDALIHLIDHGDSGQIYHIAGNQELENLELAHKILQLLKKPEDRICFIPDRNIRPGHDRRYSLDSTKLRNTGWEPKYTLDEGLKQTVEWYAKNQWWFN